MGLNEFADMTTEELEVKYFSHKLNVPKHKKLSQSKTETP
jgi:hypothetical protein